MTNPLLTGLRPTHPGEVLREIVLPSVAPGKAEIARMLGVSRQHLYDILGERKPVTTKTALRLAKLFGGDATTWCRMQMAYDLAVDRQAIEDDLARVPSLAAA